VIRRLISLERLGRSDFLRADRRLFARAKPDPSQKS
jgi:hypothetical protein